MFLSKANGAGMVWREVAEERKRQMHDQMRRQLTRQDNHSNQDNDETTPIMSASDTASEAARLPNKISAAFAARLARLAVNEQLRALIVVRREQGANAPASASGADSGSTQAATEQFGHAEASEQSRRQAHGQMRAQGAAAARAAVDEAFAAVDETLVATGGARITRTPNVLGHIAVETTRRGIEALCELDCVQTILEDQPIHPHEPVNRAE